MYITLLKKIKIMFTHLIFPQICPICGKICETYCYECIESVVAPLPPFCLECGGKYGVDCCNNSVPCFAAVIHEGLPRDLLLKLKYKNIKSLGVILGQLMAQNVPLPLADFIVPIPLHKRATREYNQTSLIAQGVSMICKIKIGDSILIWRKNRSNQTNIHGIQRTTLPLDSMISKSSVCGKKIILIDDVYTTGGTLRSAKAAIEEKGGIVVAAFLWSRRISSSEDELSWH